MAASGVVILADIVASRAVADLRRLRDERLAALSRRHLDSGLVTHAYAVTAGDEFQTLLAALAAAPRVVLDLRAAFRPVDLWISIGAGEVSSLPRGDEPVNVGGAGQAFERARQAMTGLKRGGSKVRALTVLASGDPRLDLAVNLVYRLHDSLLRQISDRQWQTILAVREGGRQDRAAAELGVDESTVSRNLRRGFYWQLEDTREALAELLREPAARRER